MRQFTLVPSALLCMSCVSAGLVLRQPLEERCQATGLHACDRVVDGMVHYVEGDKARATADLAAARDQNSPENVKKFVAAAELVTRLPGASDYTKPLGEALVLLQSTDASAAPTATTPAAAAAPVRTTSEAPPLLQAPAQEVLKTANAATDPSRIVDGIFSPGAEHIPFSCHKVTPGGATCAIVARGPLFLTDVWMLDPDCAGHFLAVVTNGHPRWVMNEPRQLAGAQLLVRDRELLVIGQRTTSGGADAEMHACDILWSGYRPYPNLPASGGRSDAPRY